MKCPTPRVQTLALPSHHYLVNTIQKLSTLLLHVLLSWLQILLCHYGDHLQGSGNEIYLIRSEPGNTILYSGTSDIRTHWDQPFCLL